MSNTGTVEKIGKKILSWDTLRIIEDEVEYRRKEEIGRDAPSDDDLCNSVAADVHLFEFEWDCVTNNLGSIMNEKNPDGHWHAKVSGFGWREQSGEKYFTAYTGVDFLNAILPKCECTFHIFEYGKDGFAIQNSHHDSPAGNEWYYVVPGEEDEFDSE